MNYNTDALIERLEKFFQGSPDQFFDELDNAELLLFGLYLYAKQVNILWKRANGAKEKREQALWYTRLSMILDKQDEQNDMVEAYFNDRENKLR